MQGRERFTHYHDIKRINIGLFSVETLECSLT